MNNRPWAQPTTSTACGRPAKYFSGIAMPSRTRNETPSRKATARKRPTAVLNTGTPRAGGVGRVWIRPGYDINAGSDGRDATTPREDLARILDLLHDTGVSAYDS